MSASDNYAVLKTIGNGSTVDFTFNWPALNASYLRVYLENATTGVQVLQTEGGGADYTVVLTSTGGTVTFNTAPTSADYVVIARVVELTQTDPYSTSKGFQGDVVEDSFDKLTLIAQDHQDALDRSITFKVGSSSSTDLPEPVADRFLGWDSGGTTLENKTIGSSTDTLPTISAPSDADKLVRINGTATGYDYGKLTTTNMADGSNDVLLGYGAAGAPTEVTASTGITISAGAISIKSAATGQVGGLETATDTEFVTGTATNKIVTPSNVKNNLGFTKIFESAEQTITSAGALSLPHGLGVIPKIVQLHLVCKAAANGNSINDIIHIQGVETNGTNRGALIKPDATNLVIRYGSDANVFTSINATTGIQENYVNANYTAVFTAWG